MWISSTGGAAQHRGGLLGQYEYLVDKGYYVQSSTEQSNGKYQAVYLYPLNDDKWHVGPTPGKKGWMYSNSPSKTPCTGDWWWYSTNTNSRGDGENWKKDNGLSITHGPLPPMPGQCTLTALGAVAKMYPSYLGLFTKTERWWRGKPVYVNTKGALLYHGSNDDGWGISFFLFDSKLKGSRGYLSPDDEDSWRYWTGSQWIPAASVTVKCST